MAEDDAKTPTRATFSNGNSIIGQKPLPTSPFPQAVQVPTGRTDNKSLPKRGNSQHSQKSRDSDDVEMEDSEGDVQHNSKDDNDGSDHESETADGKLNSKKKKSQRFYCTDYPPCTLSFTRSEHLARHIRKHTGERPFQCHCSRRFSRLDNLRQHAQTVHVNEDIPIDSLAATGARFQRQAMRPERVRQATGRARASTGGSTQGFVRGHSKSLSTSSIGSIGPGQRDPPPPLVMATDPQATSKHPYDQYHASRDGTFPQYRPVSPSDFSTTPTSATFSNGQSSPRWPSDYISSTPSHSRSQSMYVDSNTSSRRLSVPTSGNNPFQTLVGGISVRPPSFGPAGINSSHSAAFSSTNTSLLSSPVVPGSNLTRRDSTSSTTDEALRRRTWHPDSHNFHATRLSSVSTPGHYDSIQTPPLAEPNNRASSVRLPGIESFDSVSRQRHPTPPNRDPSPMMVDNESSTHLSRHRFTSGADVNRAPPPPTHWDTNIRRGLNRLEITPTSTGAGPAQALWNETPPPRDNAHNWANEANRAVLAQAEQVRLNPHPVRLESLAPSYSAGNAPVGPRSLHQHTMSAPNVSGTHDHRRRGWYNGPLPSHAEESRNTRIERMVHPNISEFSGFPARESLTTTNEPDSEKRPQRPERSRALDALVAVATGEGNTAAAY